MSAREIDPRSLGDVRVVDPVSVEAGRKQREERRFVLVAGAVLFGLCGVLWLTGHAMSGPEEDSFHRMERLQRDPSSPWYQPSKARKVEAAKAVKKPRVEYRVVENHLVKFEEGQAPYIYSMPYDVEQR